MNPLNNSPSPLPSYLFLGLEVVDPSPLSSYLCLGLEVVDPPDGAAQHHAEDHGHHLRQQDGEDHRQRHVVVLLDQLHHLARTPVRVHHVHQRPDQHCLSGGVTRLWSDGGFAAGGGHSVGLRQLADPHADLQHGVARVGVVEARLGPVLGACGAAALQLLLNDVEGLGLELADAVVVLDGLRRALLYHALEVLLMLVQPHPGRHLSDEEHQHKREEGGEHALALLQGAATPKEAHHSHDEGYGHQEVDHVAVALHVFSDRGEHVLVQEDP